MCHCGQTATIMIAIQQEQSPGGTRYTFLDAICHDCAIVLNRKCIENVNTKYRDFEEGYNCYAVSHGKELAELLNRKNIYRYNKSYSECEKVAC
jgi:hypothetical protein